METPGNNVIALTPAHRRKTFWSFRYPHELVRDPAIDADEKRAILAAWASDIHAVESLPTLRHLPGTPVPVTYSSIVDARAYLDRITGFANDDDPGPPSSPSTFKIRSHRVAA